MRARLVTRAGIAWSCIVRLLMIDAPGLGGRHPAEATYLPREISLGRYGQRTSLGRYVKGSGRALPFAQAPWGNFSRVDSLNQAVVAVAISRGHEVVMRLTASQI